MVQNRLNGANAPATTPPASSPQISFSLASGQVNTSLTTTQVQQLLDLEISRANAEIMKTIKDSDFAASVVGSAQLLAAQFNQMQNQLMNELTSCPGRCGRDRSVFRVIYEET